MRIKPHHFVDIITDYGGGELSCEPSPYGHALHFVAAQILDDRDLLLVVELGADDICRPCSHNINGLCDDTIDTSYRPKAPTSKREYNLLLDQRWCQRLSIKQGEELTARRFCELLRELAQDIADIYREEPLDLTADRTRNLNQGVKRFLQ